MCVCVCVCVCLCVCVCVCVRVCFKVLIFLKTISFVRVFVSFLKKIHFKTGERDNKV